MSDASPLGVRTAPAGPRRLLTDSRLARLAADGDTAAFEAIFARHHQEVYRYCRAILASEQDAEDALQSTMAAALRSLPGEGREIALKPWLFRVAHNESISILRRRETPVAEADTMDRAVDGVEVEAESRSRLRQLVSDLRSLPERQRSALVMRELSGLDYEQIGAALDASGAAARQTVYEARVALADLKDGREMDCEAARLAISQRDGRILRGRRIRAHLRGCEACRDFRAGIGGRRADLAALCPPLPAVAASGLLAGLLGGSSGGGSAGIAGASGAAAAKGSGVAGALAGTGGASGGGGLGGALGASAAVKAASVVAAVAVGAGAASATGVHVPLLDGSGQNEAASTIGSGGQTPPAPVAGQRASAARAAQSAAAGHGSAAAAAHRHAPGKGATGSGGGRGHGATSSRGNPAHSASPPGHAVAASHGNPQAATPPTATSTSPGTNGNAYGHGQSNAGGSATGISHRSTSSNAGGNSSHSTSSSHSTGPPLAPPGQTKPQAAPPHVAPPAITTPKPPKPPIDIPGQGNGAGNADGHVH